MSKDNSEDGGCLLVLLFIFALGLCKLSEMIGGIFSL